MWRALAILFGASIGVAAVPASPQEVGSGVRLAIVVHPTRVVQLNPEDVERIYLKQRRFWDDGEPIIAINQEPGSIARETFSRRIFGSESARLGAYWNERYFQGILPPITLSSSAAVKRYVANDRNAIGYIDLSQVDDSIRVALWLQ